MTDLIGLGILWVITDVVTGLAGRVAGLFWVNYAVEDRFEERVNGTPTRQCRIVEVDDEHDTKSITVEWDDGTQTTGRPETILQQACRIHPLAPRLQR